MLETDIFNIIKIIKNNKKLKKIEVNVDLLNSGQLDSLEMVNLVVELEDKFNFEYDKFEKQYNVISIKNIIKFLNDK